MIYQLPLTNHHYGSFFDLLENEHLHTIDVLVISLI